MNYLNYIYENSTNYCIWLYNVFKLCYKPIAIGLYAFILQFVPWIIQKICKRKKANKKKQLQRKKVQGQGQPYRGQILLRPRTGMLEA